MQEEDADRRAAHDRGGGRCAEISTPTSLMDAPSNTQRARDADWHDFEAWATGAGVSALPASAPVVASYLAARSPSLAWSTLQRRRSTIAFVHRRAGLPDPTEGAVAADAWARLRTGAERRPRPTTPLDATLLRVVIASLPDDRAGARDRVALLVGFASGLHRAELVALDVEHLRPARRAYEVALGDRALLVPRGTGPTCPVRAVQRWRRVSRVDDGPLLRSVDRRSRVGGRLSPGSVTRIVKAGVARIGEDPALYSARSLRAGLVVSSVEAGLGAEVLVHLGATGLGAAARARAGRDRFDAEALARLGL